MIVSATVRRSASLLPDVTIIVALAAFIYGLTHVANHWHAQLQPQVDISLSFWALPGYALQSLLRSFLAYGLSLTFAVAYGYIAAHNARAERLMLPLLDILQSIPVLGFLPGAVLALVTLFPRTNTGLELASILMIFTGQVWNMAFSVYQSMRSIPPELREAASLYRFNWWQRFRRVELPSSAVGLAWNSMMAMAGGWFFLTVCEAFTLGAHDFRLPGLGAYMSVAIAHRDVSAICAGLAAMVTIIVLVDVCLWRPVLVWTQKFRVSDTASAETQDSLVLSWVRRSWLAQRAVDRVAHPISEWLAARTNAQSDHAAWPAQRALTPIMRYLRLGLLTAGGVVIARAIWRLCRLLASLSPAVWMQIVGGAALTALRVGAAVLLGSLWVIPVGIWIGRSDRRRARLQPLVQIAASFPAPMLYPLLLLILHALRIGMGFGAVVLMLFGTQWYTLFNVIAGASAVPPELREVARTYRFGTWQSWWTVWWPAVFPYVVTGWVTAAGGAWNASIVAEYVTMGRDVFVAHGLGSLISVAASQGHYEVLAASVLTMAIVVVIINRVIWKPLYRHAELRYGL